MFSSSPNPWKKYLTEAKEAFRESRFDKTLDRAEAILAKEPQDAEALFLAGAAATYLQQSQRAILYLNRLATLPASESKRNLFYYRGIAYMDLAQYETALPDFSLTIEEHTLLAESYLNRGYCYLQLGQYQKASLDLHMAERYYPRMPELLDLLSFAYQQLNEPLKVERYLTRLLELEGLNEEQYMGLAWAKERLQKWPEALHAYDWAMKANPDNPLSLNNRGFLYSRLKRYEESLQDFDKAIELLPDQPYLFANRSYVRLQVNQLEAAYADIQSCLQLSPQDPYALRNRALYHLLNGESEKGLPDLEKARQMMPELDLLHYVRGRILYDLGMLEQAYSAFQQSADLGETEGQEALQQYFAD